MAVQSTIPTHSQHSDTPPAGPADQADRGWREESGSTTVWEIERERQDVLKGPNNTSKFRFLTSTAPASTNQVICTNQRWLCASSLYTKSIYMSNFSIALPQITWLLLGRMSNSTLAVSLDLPVIVLDCSPTNREREPGLDHLGTGSFTLRMTCCNSKWAQSCSFPDQGFLKGGLGPYQINCENSSAI